MIFLDRIVKTSADCLDRRKLCMNFCCPKLDFYNMETHRCEMIAGNANISWIKNLQLSDTFYKPVDILKEFEFEIKPPCSQPLGIERSDNYTILKVAVS